MIHIPVTFRWDNCSCSMFNNRTEKQTRKNIENAYSAQGYTVSILPADHNAYSINNLTETNHVENWVISGVGTDKTYIFANLNALPMDVATADASIRDPKELADKLLNNKADNILHPDLEKFIDPLWDVTLKGNPLQLFIVIKHLSFLVNSYPLINSNGVINGAVMFMRFYNPSNQNLSHELHRVLRQPAENISLKFLPQQDRYTAKAPRRSLDLF